MVYADQAKYFRGAQTVRELTFDILPEVILVINSCYTINNFWIISYLL